MKVINVILQEQIVVSPRTVEIKEGSCIKTLSYNEHVFMRVTKPTEVVGRIPGKDESKHSEASLPAFVPLEEELVLMLNGIIPGKADNKLIYAEKTVEHKTIIQHSPGDKIQYFVIEDYKENPNGTYNLKDGSKWIKVDLL